MGREQDWKEIEKTQINYEQGIKDQYKGADIIKLSKESKKTIHKMKKINAKADKIVRALLIWYVIFLVLLSIIGICIYVNYLENIKNRVNIDFIADLKNCYGIDAKIIEKDVDKLENGKYILKSKEKEPVKFVVIKEFGSYKFDYYDYTLKEEYESANENIKQTFEAQETYDENRMLKYTLNAKASNLEEVDNIVKMFVELRDKAGKHFGYDWDVNININGTNKKIWSMGENEEEKSISNRVKCEYVVKKVSEKNTSEFTDEEINRYYKPYSLKIFVNGEAVYVKAVKEKIQQTALYSYSEEDYTMLVSALENADGVHITYDKYSTPIELSYKGKTYKIGGSTADLENNTIPTYTEIQVLQQILGTEFELDYENQTINITVD